MNGRFYPFIRGADDPASGGSGASTEGGEGKGKENPDPSGSGGTGAGDKPDEDKTFKQDEVNAIVTREVSKATRGKVSPQELGFETTKELKDFLDEMKQKRESEKTEDEKAKEKEINDAKEAARNEVLSQAHDLSLKAEFKIKAHEAGVKFTDDAFLVAKTLEVWKEVAVDDNGTVTGLDDTFFEALKKEKPYLFTEEKKGASDVGAGGGGAPSPDRTEELKKVYPAMSRRSGI